MQVAVNAGASFALGVALAATAATGAFATTGAELKSSDQGWAKGYVWGLMEGYFLTWEADEQTRNNKARRLQCFIDANMTNGVFYDAVMAYIDRNPRSLAEPATGPIVRTIIEICQ